MPKIRKLKYKQHGGVKVSLRQADGTYVATEVDLDIIIAIFQNCMDMYLISASSASGMVFGATLPQPPPGGVPVAPPGVVPPNILLRSNHINEDGTLRTQEQIAHRKRYVEEGAIILECCLKISFVETVSSGMVSVTVSGYNKQTCKQSDLDKEVQVQGEIFQSNLCGNTAPLTFTPDKIAAITMSPDDFSMIVEALAARPTADPRVARALVILREIPIKAGSSGLNIHIFVMDLLKGETLRKFIESFSVTNQQRKAACNNVAIAVIVTFLKSLDWSRDQHADNVVISGAITFTLDFGLTYHLKRDEVYIKSLLESLLRSKTIIFADVLEFFGVNVYADAVTQVRDIFDEAYEMLKDQNLKELMLISPAATTQAAIDAEINRISVIVFQMLSFFALVDGLTNRYKYGTHVLQSNEYMQHVFNSSVRSFENFLKGCSFRFSNLSRFGPHAAQVRTNMMFIVKGLQPALALCPLGGQARDPLTVRYAAQSLGPFSISPGQILYDKRIADAQAFELAEQQAAARLASEQKAHADELETKQNARTLSRLLRQTISRRAVPYGDLPLSKNTHGGTVKRRFRVQKRQKQTMRPCNIRRQRRTHAVCRRRRRNKNKTH